MGSCSRLILIITGKIATQVKHLANQENQRHAQAAKNLEVYPVLRIGEGHVKICRTGKNEKQHPGNVQALPYLRWHLKCVPQHALDDNLVSDEVAGKKHHGKNPVDDRRLPLEPALIPQEQGDAAKGNRCHQRNDMVFFQLAVGNPDTPVNHDGGPDQDSGRRKNAVKLVGGKEEKKRNKVQPLFHARLQGVLKWRILSDPDHHAMPVVDLHTHSICSDGALSPADLVTRAHAAGVEVLALTDHDSVIGVPEATATVTSLGMRLLPGLELSTLWKGFSVHVVGLGLDIHHPGLVAGLAKQADARGERARAIAARLDKAKRPGAYEAALALAGGEPNRISRTHFAQWLVQTGAVSSMQGAFDKYLGNGKPGDVPMPWVDLQTAVGLIRSAGGTAVLAHPGRYPLTRTKLRTLIGLFKEAGGEAMEVATATEKPDVVRYLGQLTTQFDLEASQGSDFHGPHIPWIQLGRFPPLPAECRPVWRRWISGEEPV